MQNGLSSKKSRSTGLLKQLIMKEENGQEGDEEEAPIFGASSERDLLVAHAMLDG